LTLSFLMIEAWNISLLRHLFYNTNVQQILNIHLSQRPSLDKWIWGPFLYGNFTIKFAQEIFIQNT
jgi:hypothetical protein